MLHTIRRKLLLLHELLALFEKQLSKTNLDHLEKGLIFSSKTCLPFRSKFASKFVGQLSQQFNKRFEDFDQECDKINIYPQNPSNVILILCPQ